jgi:hypothetical protein
MALSTAGMTLWVKIQAICTAALEFTGEPLQGVHQSQIVQHAGPQADSHGADLFDGGVHQGADSRRAFGPLHILVLQTLLQPDGIHAQARSAVAPVRRAVRGRWRPLFFLVGHDGAGQPAQLLLGVFQGGDVGGDAADAPCRLPDSSYKGKLDRKKGVHAFRQWG